MTVFHYTSGLGLFGILNSKQIHCSHIEFLNDPSEREYFSKLLREVLDENIGLKMFFVENSSIEKFEEEYYETNQFVFSASKHNDSLTMWNYYATGNGYNFGININSLIKRNKDLLIDKVKIEYNYKKQYEKIKEYVTEYKDKYDSKESIKDFEKGLFKLQLKFKHQAYEIEQEVRLIITKPNFCNFKVSKTGVFVQYISLDIDIHNDISEIIIHPLGNKLKVLGIINFLEEKNIEFNNDKIQEYCDKEKISLQEFNQKKKTEYIFKLIEIRCMSKITSIKVKNSLIPFQEI